MKIYLASDLHVECFKNFGLPQAAVDVIVLAGDIHSGTKALEVAAEFQRLCRAPVVFVGGNHEYYGTDLFKQLKTFRGEAKRFRDVFFLENSGIEIQGVRFLGCTLWTDFELFGHDRVAESKSMAHQFIADFRKIRFRGRRLTPDDAAAEFQRSYAWLNEELAKPFQGKTVVVTHFLPHKAGIHARHASTGGDYLTPYFTNDCSELMQRYPIDIWMYGHTHNSVDVTVENRTRLVSNQRDIPMIKKFIRDSNSIKLLIFK